ncbi:hypothetical protein WCD74_29695, partial [Actinomycetospora sp. OC33-EN08]
TDKKQNSHVMSGGLAISPSGFTDSLTNMTPRLLDSAFKLIQNRLRPLCVEPSGDRQGGSRTLSEHRAF